MHKRPLEIFVIFEIRNSDRICLVCYYSIGKSSVCQSFFDLDLPKKGYNDKMNDNIQ